MYTPDDCHMEEIRPTLRKMLDICEAEGLNLEEVRMTALYFNRMIEDRIRKETVKYCESAKFHVAE